MAAATALSPDQILRDLANLWVTLGKQGQPETGLGVLRACTLNLVVVADEDDDFQALGETVAALMPEHPARTIVIRLHAAPAAELTGRVFSQCWMPFGQRRQICCEQIEITASRQALDDALSLAAAVTAPDLPVIAWCRMDQPDFLKISGRANRVIVDSARFPDPRATLARLKQLVAEGIPLGDLSWTRLTRWREMLSQAFANQRLPAAVQVKVRFDGKNAPVPARYMGAWVAESLRAAGVSVSLSLEADSSAEDGQLSHVEFNGDRLSIELAYSLPAATDYSLMREELGIVRRDPVFEQTLRAAVAL
jgi:glucose-6-phosphate dehydrogenase assembly protein OpcA